MDQKNFIVAIVLSVLIIVGWQVACSRRPSRRSRRPAADGDAVRRARAPAARRRSRRARRPAGRAGAAAGAAAVVSRTEALARTPRVTFNTPELLGSISLKGARIDDVQLVKYRETIDPKSPPVPVLSPVGSAHPYYAEFGWSSSDPARQGAGPGHGVDGRAADASAPGKPVQLTWDNGEGLIFALDRRDRRVLHVRRSSRASRTRPTSR